MDHAAPVVADAGGNVDVVTHEIKKRVAKLSHNFTKRRREDGLPSLRSGNKQHKKCHAFRLRGVCDNVGCMYKHGGAN